MTIIRYLGGPTALIEYGDLRLLTDPTFDEAGDYVGGGGSKLTKLAGPAVPAEGIGLVDAVLLSHDQHPDNLDTAGRAYAAEAPLVLSTASALERLGGPVRALANWETYEHQGVRITGVPAQHGPEGSLPVVGEVTGFVLAGEGLPTVYVSGDNASLDVVSEIRERTGPVDIAVLFAGGARTGLFEGAYLTLSSEQAAQAAEILGAQHVVPLHFEQWAHFSQGRDTLPGPFERAGLAERLHLLKPGEQVEL